MTDEPPATDRTPGERGIAGSGPELLSGARVRSDALVVARKTKTAWFGPKRWGWGWSPASWQGWVVTLAFSVAGQIVRRRARSSKERLVANLVLVAFFFGVIALTGDPPGSRRRMAGAEAVDEVAPST